MVSQEQLTKAANEAVANTIVAEIVEAIRQQTDNLYNKVIDELVSTRKSNEYLKMQLAESQVTTEKLQELISRQETLLSKGELHYRKSENPLH